jgi:hypothetical protein
MTRRRAWGGSLHLPGHAPVPLATVPCWMKYRVLKFDFRARTPSGDGSLLFLDAMELARHRRCDAGTPSAECVLHLSGRGRSLQFGCRRRIELSIANALEP